MRAADRISKAAACIRRDASSEGHGDGMEPRTRRVGIGSGLTRTAQCSIFSELYMVGSRSIANAMYLSCSLPLTASARRLHAFCRDASSEGDGMKPRTR